MNMNMNINAKGLIPRVNRRPPLWEVAPSSRILMGPGPSDVHPRVLAALAKPTIGHLDPEFQALMEEIKTSLRYVFQTRNSLTYPVSGPGSVGMETCFANLVEPGDKVVVAQNGSFGGRMRENVVRFGGTSIDVKFDWGKPVDPNAIEDALKANPGVKVLAFVHAETSTGALSDAETLIGLARKYDCLSIVDAVTSLGGMPLMVDEWGADAVYSGTQKCLSCPPGLSPVTFSDRAAEVAKTRKTPVASWFNDLNLVMQYWSGAGGRTYHHTAPVNALYGLYESLVMLEEEGLEHSWARHTLMHQAFVAGLEAMGLEMHVAKEYRLPSLNAVRIPEWADDKTVRAQLLSRYGLEIGAGIGALGGKVWRIGLMGQSATVKNILLCLKGLEDVLAPYSKTIIRNKATDTALHALAGTA
jgi:alanine-glyoxylate transaminase / serine-glyoxylate transaminase / serine-pyruvate transaminase